MELNALARNPGAEHALALVLAGRCRRCAERLPGGIGLGGGTCKRCGEAQSTTAAERARLESLFQARTTGRLHLALALVAAAALVTSLLPLFSALVLAGALIWLRAGLVRPTLRLFSPRRRLVSQWTLRLAAAAWLALSFALLEAVGLVPIVALGARPLIAALQVALAALVTRRYLAFQVRRELDARPLESWELALAGSLLVVVLGSVLALAFVVQWLLGLLSLWSP